MKAPLHFAVLLNGSEKRNEELMDIRNLLEVHLAGLAAKHATEEDLTAMRCELAGLLQSMGDIVGWCAHEIRFHEAIARAARHSVMLSIMEMLAELLYEQRRKTVESLTDFLEGFQLHYRVFEQIERRDPTAAEDAMRAHFEGLRTRVGLTTSSPAEDPEGL